MLALYCPHSQRTGRRRVRTSVLGARRRWTVEMARGQSEASAHFLRPSASICTYRLVLAPARSLTIGANGPD